MAKITALVENAGQVLTCAADAPDLVGARTNTVVAISGNAIAAVGTPADGPACRSATGAGAAAYKCASSRSGIPSVSFDSGTMRALDARVSFVALRVSTTTVA